ncbi:MAG TPA: hypothetical protein DEH22_17070 [Chloroflexi bacterium]|nr:hypothetical protein [Chloroflexota bacterium]
MMQLEKLSTYACYYGSNRLADLAQFDLVILQPDHYAAGDIRLLCEQNTCPVAYLAISEEPATQSPSGWALIDPSNGLVVRNLAWQTVLVDCRSQAWHNHILQQRIPEIIARGFVGIFLDTLDVAEQYPETRQGVIRLIRQIRAFYPHLMLVANRGFSILDEINELVDAFLFEAFTTHSTHGITSNYAIWDNQALAWTAQQVDHLHAKGVNIPILALDYAAPSDTALRSAAWRRAQKYGLLSFTTTRFVDWLPKIDTDR